jgi:16S rRNA U516 pseudouridylate synthase RsuA-like enzyme
MWGQIKPEIMKMVHHFNNNTLDLRRLNYGVITLILKVKETNTIKQYKPIYLLNANFKIFHKLLTDRITLIADS